MTGHDKKSKHEHLYKNVTPGFLNQLFNDINQPNNYDILATKSKLKLTYIIKQLYLIN